MATSKVLWNLNMRHRHNCVRCGKSFVCKFGQKRCLSTGTMWAAQSNHEGPYCEACRKAEMARRVASVNDCGMVYERN
jgi:hypothetical protein